MKSLDFNFNYGKNILRKAVALFPNGSGIYKFIDSKKNILYVGKAKNLKKEFLHI